MMLKMTVFSLFILVLLAAFVSAATNSGFPPFPDPSSADPNPNPDKKPSDSSPLIANIEAFVESMGDVGPFKGKDSNAGSPQGQPAQTQDSGFPELPDPAPQ